MSEILKPEVIWIEGRCYRANDPLTYEVNALQEYDLYENESTINDMMDEDDDDLDIVMVDNSRYTTSVHVPKHYIGYLIGKKGATKIRIERDTRTNIKIPKQGQTGDIVIFGSTPSNVKAARRRINMIVVSSRMKQRATHFLSIPMNTGKIVENFEIFKERVLKECSNSTLEDSIFIRSQKLHLTMGVMCLMDNEERLLVSKHLREAKENIVLPLLRNHMPLKLRLKGLSYMNDNPHEIDVLYGHVVEENGEPGLLQELADSLVQYFYKLGYMDKEYGRDNIKLHVTLINSKYRGENSEIEQPDSNNSTRKPRVSFDGSEILKKFANYDFGVMELSEIHLSQRHSIDSEGYYQSTCVISCV